MKKKQIEKRCYVEYLTGGFIVASDQLTTASLFLKEVIKIPKRQSKSVYRRRTDNTTIYKTYI